MLKALLRMRVWVILFIVLYSSIYFILSIGRKEPYSPRDYVKAFVENENSTITIFKKTI